MPGPLCSIYRMDAALQNKAVTFTLEDVSGHRSYLITARSRSEYQCITSGSSLKIVNRKGRFTLFNLSARFLRNGIVKLKIGSTFFNLTCCTYEQIFYFGSTLHFRYWGISGCLCNRMKEAERLNFQTMSCPSFLSAMIKRETKCLRAQVVFGAKTPRAYFDSRSTSSEREERLLIDYPHFCGPKNNDNFLFKFNQN